MRKGAMIAADRPRAAPAKLLTIDGKGRLRHRAASQLPYVLRAGDIVVANDAATLPASLHGTHEATNAVIEVRLAGRPSLDDPRRFLAIVFGVGDHRTRTEERAPPPALAAGDRLILGPLTATIERRLGHPRLVALRFEGELGRVWQGIAAHGKPIQYAHVPASLAMWDVWTKIAGEPVAFEVPSASFIFDWSMIRALHARVGFATLTHAAGISSTGDEGLDRRLPFDEAYRIPAATAAAIRRAKAEGGRIVAVGTSVVRALEDSGRVDGAVHEGQGIATSRVGPTTRLRIVDAIVSGVHAAGESHHELLRAFADDAVLADATLEMEALAYRNHEFGDFVFVERKSRFHRESAQPETKAACV
jgi:S-adenosylmethionine:tRNA ribosyltransferase-isomerase